MQNLGNNVYYYLYAKYKGRVAMVGKYMMSLEAIDVADSQRSHHKSNKIRFFVTREEFNCPISYSQLGTEFVLDQRRENANKDSGNCSAS